MVNDLQNLTVGCPHRRRLNAEYRVIWRALTLAQCALEDGPESADGARERGIFRRVRSHRVLQEREQGFLGGEPRYRAVLHRRRHSLGAARARTKTLQCHRHAGETLTETLASDHGFLLKTKIKVTVVTCCSPMSPYSFLLNEKEPLIESFHLSRETLDKTSCARGCAFTQLLPRALNTLFTLAETAGSIEDS